MSLKEFDFTDFWEDEDPFTSAYISAPFGEEELRKTEQELGVRLPESYLELCRMHNGGLLRKNSILFKEPTEESYYVSACGIFGIGREVPYSLLGSSGKELAEEWEYPDIGPVICDCPSAGHEMIFLDYRECGPEGEPRVVMLLQEDDYSTQVLAENFEEFIRKLISEEDADTYCKVDAIRKKERRKQKQSFFQKLIRNITGK